MSGRPNHAPARGPVRMAVPPSIRVPRLTSVRSRVPPPAPPFACVRSASAAPPSRSRVTARSRGASRRKAGSRRMSPTQTRSSRPSSGAATGAFRRPETRPVPSAPIRPDSLALAPARFVTSRLSTTRLPPSDWMLAAMVPVPEFAAP